MTKILLVEDNADLCEAIGELLSAKYDVTMAPNGKAAQALMLEKSFDLVISDAQMPHMNGLQLLRWIKAEKPTPCILMTGYSELLETKSTFDLEVANFIVKPFYNTDLIDAVHEVLQQSRTA